MQRSWKPFKRGELDQANWIAWAQMDKYWRTFKAVMFSIVLFFLGRVAKGRFPHCCCRLAKKN
jgi:hypothetical protein